MALQAGSFLASTAALDGTVFEKATVFISEYNERGATGFILNKPFGRRLNELEEFKDSPAFPIYEGGPVDQEHLFFVHRRPELAAGGEAVNGIYTGGDFKQAVTAIKAHTLTPADAKILLGYCGWDAGELEAEIAEGSWVEVKDGKVFA